MSQTNRLTTADQLIAMPDDGHSYELVDGELRMMAPAGGRHGRITMKLGRLIGDYVEDNSLGETFAAETGFLLGRDPDTVRAPDVAFVSHARLGGLADEPGYLPVVPDFVAEVISPRDRSSSVDEKVSGWLAAGVRTVMVVDSQSRTVYLHRSADRREVYTSGPMDLGPAIAGCVLDVSDLFS